MTKYFIIANPATGRGARERAVPRVKNLLEIHTADSRLVITERPWHGAELAREASADYDVVVAASGDGTVNVVLNRLVQAGPEDKYEAALWVIGAGHGNDFADTVDIPDDLVIACNILVHETSRRNDIGRVHGGRWPATRGRAPTGTSVGHLWPVE